MTRKLGIVKLAYWTGIVIDAVAAILLMSPALAAELFRWSTYQPSAGLNSIAGYAASLMWGWTFLLFWAQRKPVERRGVLLLTLFPVLAGLILNKILDVRAGLTDWLPAGLIQPILVILFLSAYFSAQDLASREPPTAAMAAGAGTD